MKLLTEYFGKPESPWQAAGWVLVFAFVALSLVADHVASTVFAIFFLAGLWLLIRGRYERPDPLMKWVLIAFAAYFLVGVLSFFLAEEQTRLGEKILGRDIRFLGAVAVFSVLVHLAMPYRLFASAILVGGVATGLVAIVQVMSADTIVYRASGQTISILFGHLAAGLALLNAAFAMQARLPGRILFLTASAAAIVAVLLSDTRGALLCLLLILPVIVLSAMRLSASSWRRALIVLASLVVIGVYPRLNSVVTEVARFKDHAESIGQREWPQLPACVNDREFLEWVVANSITSGEANLVVDVEPFDAIDWTQADTGCTGNYVITIANPDDQQAGWIYLPERSVPLSGAKSELIASGSGQISLALTPRESRINLDAAQPASIELDQKLSSDPRFLLVLYPGDRMVFAPIVHNKAEYAFTNQTSSSGARILMWQAALSAFQGAPLVGTGTGMFPSILSDHAHAGQVPWQIVRFDHAHNEILYTAAERGIVGLLALFAVYAAPFWLFYRRRDVFGVAGMAFVVSIFISGLTETIFNHSLGITYYSMFVLLLATAPREPLPAPLTRQKD